MQGEILKKEKNVIYGKHGKDMTVQCPIEQEIQRK
jgi:hypothetical protein